MLYGWFFAEGKDSPDTMLRVALSYIFIEGYAEKFSEPGRNERCKIPDLVEMYGLKYDCLTAGGLGNAEVVNILLYKKR